MPAQLATRKILYLGTHLVETPGRAAEIRDQRFPPTASPGPAVAVLDLGGARYTPAALHELIVPLGQRLRGGVFGELRIVITAPDEATAEVLALLAEKHDLPLFIAQSSRPEDVEDAVPAGSLTTAEAETLDGLRDLGGGVTAAGYAGVFGLTPNAANNRLLNLERKGYVLRVKRSRKTGDLYIDPRAAGIDAPNPSMPEIRPMRDALLTAGIRSDPYDRSRKVVLEGDAAERAAEILRRRGKAK